MESLHDNIVLFILIVIILQIIGHGLECVINGRVGYWEEAKMWLPGGKKRRIAEVKKIAQFAGPNDSMITSRGNFNWADIKASNNYEYAEKCIFGDPFSSYWFGKILTIVVAYFISFELI